MRLPRSVKDADVLDKAVLVRADLKHLSASALHYASVDDAVRGQRVAP